MPCRPGSRTNTITAGGNGSRSVPKEIRPGQKRNKGALAAACRDQEASTLAGTTAMTIAACPRLVSAVALRVQVPISRP